MKTLPSFVTFVCLVLLLSVTNSLFAIGALFSRPRGSDQEYQKMWIKTVNVDVEIQDQVAVTHVDQIFYNEMNTSVETIYIFPLPENAMITELIYWANGKRYVAEIRERQEAVNDYNRRLRQWLDPALLEYLGDNLFRLSIVPVNAKTEVRTEITYAEPLTYDMGKVSYTFLLNTLELSPQPLQSVSLDLDAQTQTGYKSFSSPSHQNSTATRIEKVADNHYHLFFGDENFYPDQDLIVEFETVMDNVDMRVLTYVPEPADSFGTDRFYAMWITPPDTVEGNEVIPKDIVFTADVSSSMDGERMEQVKEALYNLLDLLNADDRFNIITFGTFVEKFRDDFVKANENNINDARDFVYQMYALGMTNIDEGLKTSLSLSYRDTSSNNLIFLTDGKPTWGETNQDSILAHVQKLNTSEVRIFSFGVGEDISRALLYRLSEQNHGYDQYIAADDSIALVVNKHFQRISKPVLRNVRIDFGGLDTWDRYPKQINDLFWGTQLLYMGLYDNAGTFPVTLKGDMRSEQFEETQMVTFSDTLGGHRFIPRLWARAKIDHLMDLIEIYGETDELVDQIVELSLRFQILTPYTAFYSDPDDDSTPIEEEETHNPNQFVLYQNYPNPFNPSTEIKYQLPQSQSVFHVIIKIYDALGRLVKVLVDEKQGPGIHKVRWDGTDLRGNRVPSGVYYYMLKTESFVQTRKMVLLR